MRNNFPKQLKRKRDKKPATATNCKVKIFINKIKNTIEQKYIRSKTDGNSLEGLEYLSIFPFSKLIF